MSYGNDRIKLNSRRAYQQYVPWRTSSEQGVITRPAEPDDYCYSCGEQIVGDVAEVVISPAEIHFLCAGCVKRGGLKNDG